MLFQPPTLTLVLESSNLFFSALFAVEMVLKIFAEGLFDYLKNGFNVFDSFIVILRYFFSQFFFVNKLKLIQLIIQSLSVLHLCISLDCIRLTIPFIVEFQIQVTCCSDKFMVPCCNQPSISNNYSLY